MQREQYGVTVHLLIGTGRSPDKITFMSLTLTANNKASCQGLNSLFSFRSVLSSTFVVVLSQNFSGHTFDARSSCSRVVSSYHACFHPKVESSCISLCYTEKHISHVFEDLRKRKAPNSSQSQYQFVFVLTKFRLRCERRHLVESSKKHLP
jgi:hypothetical protein